jgi:hypothetical protein
MADEQCSPGAQPSAPASENKLSAFGGLAAVKAAAAQLPANTVQVDPGGATFPTISAALASINDASAQKEYLLYIGPGTYNEQVTLKPYVYLHGAGKGQTIVNAPPNPDAFSRGTIIAASNSSIEAMTVTCNGGTWGNWATALVVSGCSPFTAGNVDLSCDDLGNAGINMETCAVNWNTFNTDPVQFYLNYSTVTANAQSHDTSGMALMVNGPANVQCFEAKVVATGGSNPIGAASNGGATLGITYGYAEGALFALDIPDYNSTLIATNCQINGPVQNGVKIVHYTPPGENTGGKS